MQDRHEYLKARWHCVLSHELAINNYSFAPIKNGNLTKSCIWTWIKDISIHVEGIEKHKVSKSSCCICKS